MNVLSLPVGPFAANCHIVWDPAAPEAAFVADPGAEAPRIAAALRDRGLRPAAVLLTHGHADHVAALAAFLAAFPCPVHLHPADAAWAFTALNRIPPYPVPAAPPEPPRPAGEGDVVRAGPLAATALHTPGHTPGCLCWRIAADADDGPATLLSGDTLFAGSIGRTDLPGGDWRAMGRSLRRLRDLPPALAVLPGHGPSTTIGDELRSNPYLA